MEEKIPSFQGTSRSQTHLTVGEGQYTLLLPRQRSTASGKGAEKKPSVLWRGGKPTGPRTHANTKPPSATTGGRTRSSLSPKTIHRPRLRVWPHWEEGKGTLGVLPPRHRPLGPVQYLGQTMKTQNSLCSQQVTSSNINC